MHMTLLEGFFMAIQLFLVIIRHSFWVPCNAASKTNQTDDQDISSHLLRSLGSHSALCRNRDTRLLWLLHKPQNFLNNGAEMVTALPANGAQGLPITEQRHCTVTVAEMLHEVLHGCGVQFEDLSASSFERQGLKLDGKSLANIQGKENPADRNKLKNFDLDDPYVDLDDGIEDLESSPVPADQGTSNSEYPSWMQWDFHQSSPPQASGNSDSASAQSPSGSSGDA